MKYPSRFLLVSFFLVPFLLVFAVSSPTSAIPITTSSLSSPAADTTTGAGDVLSRSAVIVTLAGVWSPAAVRNASFAAAVERDVAVALGPQRAAAWQAVPPDANGGPATVELEAWADGGALVDRLLLAADWAYTQEYYAEMEEGGDPAASAAQSAADGASEHMASESMPSILSGSSSPSNSASESQSESESGLGNVPRSGPTSFSVLKQKMRKISEAELEAAQTFIQLTRMMAVDESFVTATRRSEDISLHFSGTGWGNPDELPDAELSEAILSAVQSVVDPTNTGGNLRCSIEDPINRTNGVVFNLLVTSSGVQNITKLLTSPSLYDSLLTYYFNVTELSDAALVGVYRTPVESEEQEYRTQVRTLFSGSWNLVLQTAKPQVIAALRSSFAEALELNISRIVLADVSGDVYPFNMQVIYYVVHQEDFLVNNITSAIANANFSELFDNIYVTYGGDTTVTPAVMESTIVNSREARDESESDTSLTSTHNLLLSGEEWPDVIRLGDVSTLNTAIAKDLTELLPYKPNSVSVEGLPQPKGEDGLRVVVSVKQQGVAQIIPFAVNSYFVQASSLPLTQTFYRKYVDAVNTEMINVTCATVENKGFRSICTSRCIGVSVMGGCLLLFCIIGFIIYCVWRSLARYVDPAKYDDELVRIPPHLSPFAGGVVTSPNYNPIRTFYGGGQNVNYRVGDPGPMYPPGSTGTVPFGARNPFSTPAAPESRLVALSGSQSNASVLRQGAVVIPSTTGDRSLDMVMVPREEYERQQNV